MNESQIIQLIKENQSDEKEQKESADFGKSENDPKQASQKSQNDATSQKQNQNATENDGGL